MIDRSKSATAIYNEDCLRGMSRLKSGAIDIVVTSPPYNIGIGYGSYNDRIPRDEYLRWIGEWADIVFNILNDSGSLFLNIGSKPTQPDVPFQVLGILRRRFKLQNTIHWIKSIYIDTDCYGEKLDINVGHYKPINSPRFLNDTHEYIFHLTKDGRVSLDRLALGVPYKDKSNIGRWKSGKSRVRCRGNCWFIPYETIQNRDTDRPHPASFPPRLAEDCIRLHGLQKGLKVLDPFMGIGNTGLACKKLGIEFIGFEIDQAYFNTARKVLIAKGGETY